MEKILQQRHHQWNTFDPMRVIILSSFSSSLRHPSFHFCSLVLPVPTNQGDPSVVMTEMVRSLELLPASSLRIEQNHNKQLHQCSQSYLECCVFAADTDACSAYKTLGIFANGSSYIPPNIGKLSLIARHSFPGFVWGKLCCVLL